jgi:septal ring factor EnvC (AmiA/AmiB activator)
MSHARSQSRDVDHYPSGPSRGSNREIGTDVLENAPDPMFARFDEALTVQVAFRDAYKAKFAQSHGESASKGGSQLDQVGDKRDGPSARLEEELVRLAKELEAIKRHSARLERELEAVKKREEEKDQRLNELAKRVSVSYI